MAQPNATESLLHVPRVPAAILHPDSTIANVDVVYDPASTNAPRIVTMSRQVALDFGDDDVYLVWIIGKFHSVELELLVGIVSSVTFSRFAL